MTKKIFIFSTLFAFILIVQASAATVSVFKSAIPDSWANSRQLVKKTIDMTSGLSAITTGDVVQLLAVPAGTLIINVREVTQVADATANGGTVGDTADHVGFLTTFNGASAPTYSTSTSNAVFSAAGGKFYTSADTLSWYPTANAALSTGKFDFIIELIPARQL